MRTWHTAPFTSLPRLYAILDAEMLIHADLSLEAAALALYQAGVRWVQYRDKHGSDAEVVASMRVLRKYFVRGESTLLLNDRVHLRNPAQSDGIHLGQQDMPIAKARILLGTSSLLGVSTHNESQVRAAVKTGAADYVAIGPVFQTSTKRNPDRVVGLAGVAAARALTGLPLVAIGGIAPEAASSVIEAGADAVAMISALMPGPDQTMTERVRDILLLLQ